MDTAIDRMRLLLPILAFLLAGCNRGALSGEPFTTAQPKAADIPGSYLLVSQTLTTNGLSELKGQRCELDLSPDGTFTITNYFDWHYPGGISTTGRWRCETIGFTRGQSIWGIRFDSSPQIEAAALSGYAAPYRLVMIFGDPDSNDTMVYEKKK